MRANIKRFVIIITLFSVIFCVNKPISEIIEIPKPQIVSSYMINSGHKINSFLSLSGSKCDLRFAEMVIKYIFHEDGDEIDYQIKYINQGSSDNCIIRKNLTKPYNISEANIEGADNLNYKIDSNLLEINFYLKSDKYAILSYKLFYKYNPSKFYRTFTFYIEKE